ncbi:unnamed protein product [Caenorhabditis sp. 36 PRJEB53466]|nr:unnamed protein product [Caenorhabditis sp. 36 PRJEB53466]
MRVGSRLLAETYKQFYLFYHDTVSYDDASDYCYNDHEAFLTGPDSTDEYNYIIDQAYDQSDVVDGLASGPYDQALIIIGAKRTSECTTDSGTIAECQLPRGFIWQDGLGDSSNTLFNQYFNPNGVETSAANVRSCAGIMVYRNESYKSNDLVYSVSCSDGTSSSGTQSRMVVCGKRGQCAPPTPTTVSSTTVATSVPSSTSLATTTSALSSTTDCPVKVCRDGWYQTTRNGEVWCLHLFFKWTKYYEEASDYCVDSWNSVLSGPDSQTDYNYVMSQMTAQQDVIEGFERGQYEKVFLVLGAQRTPNCTTDPGLNPQCQLPNGYQWLDGVTGSSNALFNLYYNSGGPTTSEDDPQACVGILVYTDPSRVSENLVYSFNCDEVTTADGTVKKLVVCGQPGICPDSDGSLSSTTVKSSTASSTIISSTYQSTSVSSTVSTRASTTISSTVTTRAPTTIGSSSTVTQSSTTVGSGSSTTTTISAVCSGDCYPGWFKTARGGQTLCIRLFYHDTSNYTDASDYCENEQNGFLTGPETNPEYDEIIRQAYNYSDVLTGMAPYTEGMMMIGLMRTAECFTDSGSVPECQLPRGFEWKDGLGGTSNTLVNSHMGTRGVETSTTTVRACVGILVYTDSSQKSQDLVYSVSCDDGTSSTGTPSRMVVCGQGSCASTTTSTTITSTAKPSSTTTLLTSTLPSSTSAVTSTVKPSSTSLGTSSSTGNPSTGAPSSSSTGAPSTTAKGSSTTALSTSTKGGSSIASTQSSTAVSSTIQTSTTLKASSTTSISLTTAASSTQSSTLVSSTTMKPTSVSTTTGSGGSGTCSGDCQEGWFKTVRGGQIFCIHLFYHNSGSYTEASDYCVDEYSAVLTGPDTNDEYNYIIGQAYTQSDVVDGMDSGPYEKAMIIIGAQRTSACTANNGSTDPQCALPQGFVWMDGLGQTSNTLFNQHFNPGGVETSTESVRACVGILVYHNSSWMSQDLVYSMNCSDATSSNGTPARISINFDCSSFHYYGEASFKLNSTSIKPSSTVVTSTATPSTSSRTTTALLSTKPGSTSTPSTTTATSTTVKPSSTVASSTTLLTTILTSTATPFASTTRLTSTSTPSTSTLPTTTLTTTTLPPTTTKTCANASMICATGWTLSQRSSTRRVCLKVVNGYNMTYDESDALCQSQSSDAYLSGIDNVTEYNTVVGLAQSTVNYTTSTNEQIVVTIALKRRTICLAYTDDEDCSVFKAYVWQESSVQYQKILDATPSLFADGQPATNGTVPMECVGIMVSVDGSANANNGLMYSTYCTSGEQSSGMSNAALCARPPDVCP